MLGIDDWAWRKGHRYGTILCDLETRKVVDLLPDRDANTVAAWLRQHPGTEIISRDLGGIYAEAARRAAPQAVQVADRWHLLRNLSEALCRAISPHHGLFSQAAKLAERSPPHLFRFLLLPGVSVSCWCNKPTGRGVMNDGNRCGNSSSRQALLIRNSHGSSAWITEQ
ncbi:transposase [Granulicella tundricola]|uniref:transposase n=1 Tax=Granulicella tundricola TaxID=940615 RepID=UPI0001DB8127|nr:transposase [Granulicella tundricola]